MVSRTILALLRLDGLVIHMLEGNGQKRASRKKSRAMASLIFFTVLNVVLVGILWMGLTAAQSSITGVACLTSGTKANTVQIRRAILGKR